MTFKEKLQQEHPESVSDKFKRGCEGCPCVYGYEDDFDECGEENGEGNCEYCWNREIPETDKKEKEQFTKADLKDGMRVVYRDGRERIVLKGKLCKITVYNGLDGYNEELMNDLSVGRHLDIMKVYEDSELIWEREEPKKMTHEEIEKALGYKFELVEGE